VTTPNPADSDPELAVSADGLAPSDSTSSFEIGGRPGIPQGGTSAQTNVVHRRHGFYATDSASKKALERTAAAADVASTAVIRSGKGLARSGSNLKRSASKRGAEARDKTAAAITRAGSQLGGLVRKASKRISGSSSTKGLELTRTGGIDPEAVEAEKEAAMLAAAENRYSRLGSPSSPLKAVNASPSASTTSISMADAARISPPPGRPPSSGSEHRASGTSAQTNVQRPPSRRSAGR
jgi:hypothetical protein